MVKIKICGLKRVEDISYANTLSIDYAGFVFAPSSRQIDLKLAVKLIERLDKRIKKVGVFVNESREVITKCAAELDLDVIQMHGNENPAAVMGYGSQVWKAFRINGIVSLPDVKLYPVDGILLDTAVSGCYGGSGQVFDWAVVEQAEFSHPLILAGGLNASNAVEAIRRVRPYAVDVSSGVEIGGVKDFNKMQQFVERVRMECS